MPLSAGYPVMLLVARKQLAHAGLFRNRHDQAVRLNAEVTSTASRLTRDLRGHDSPDFELNGGEATSGSVL